MTLQPSPSSTGPISKPVLAPSRALPLRCVHKPFKLKHCPFVQFVCLSEAKPHPRTPPATYAVISSSSHKYFAVLTKPIVSAKCYLLSPSLLPDSMGAGLVGFMRSQACMTEDRRERVGLRACEQEKTTVVRARSAS